MINIHEPENLSPEEYFPSKESFQDFTGKQREFLIDLHTQERGYFLRANEMHPSDKDGGYSFAAYSPTDPFFALGLLRNKIQKGLATRYLFVDQDERIPGHDRLKGHIGAGGVIVDGEFVPYDELCSILEIYVGFQFSLKIVDPFDEM